PGKILTNGAKLAEKRTCYTEITAQTLAILLTSRRSLQPSNHMLCELAKGLTHGIECLSQRIRGRNQGRATCGGQSRLIDAHTYTVALQVGLRNDGLTGDVVMKLSGQAIKGSLGAINGIYVSNEPGISRRQG